MSRNRSVWISAVVCAVLWSGFLARTAEAQDPRLPPNVRLPAGGPRTIVGIVVDSSARPQPIGGAAVTIRGVDRTVITGADGIFRFDSLSPGTYEVRARRIGYEPRVGSAKLPDDGTIVFALVPLSRTLAPIVSSAVMGGVGGFVSDTGRNPLKGMSVRVFGDESRRAVTDARGRFHIDAPAGQYMLEVTGKGFRSELISFNIPRDSGRLVSLTMIQGRLRARDVLARDDLQRRIVWRRFGARIFTREDLSRLTGTSLTDVVRTAADRPFNEDDCVLMLNGLPIAWPMWMYQAEDLDMVEVYPPGTMGTVRGQRVPSGVGRDGRGGAARVCPTIYIWQRK